MVASWWGSKIVSGRENDLMLPTPLGSFAFWNDMSLWPSIWRLAPAVVSPRSTFFGSH